MHSFSIRTAFRAWMLMALASGSAYGGIVNTLLRGGAGDGKIAKYQFTLHENMVVTSVAWSPDGNYIAATSSQTGAIHLWNIVNRKLVANVGRDSIGDFGELSWSPDGRYLPVCGAYGKLRIYSAPALAEIHTIVPTDKHGCEMTAFSSDGRRLAALGVGNHTLAVYSTDDWRETKSYDIWNGWARGHIFKSIAFIPGTLTLAVGGGEFEHRGDLNPMNGFIYLYRADDSEPSRRIPVYRYDESLGPPGPVNAVTFSADGTRVATGTDTGAGFTPNIHIKVGVRVLDVSDGRILGSPLDGSGVMIRGPGGLQFTSNGKYLITGHVDRQSPIHIIDAKTVQIADAVPSGGTVYDITTNPRGPEFAAGVDKSIVVWSLTAQP